MKYFPKLTTLTPSKSNYPQKQSEKNLIGFEDGISYLMDTATGDMNLTLTGDVTGSGNVENPISTTISNKNISLFGDITGSGIFQMRSLLMGK